MQGVGVPAEDIVRCRRPLSGGHGRCRQLVVVVGCSSSLGRLVQRVEGLRVRIGDGCHRVQIVQLVVTLRRSR